MLYIFSTFEVFMNDKSNDINFLQYWNIQDIFLTFSILKDDKLREIKLYQFEKR